MSAVQFFLPHLTATVAGIALPGAQFEFLQTGTTTPLTVYSDEALTIPRTNPVVCNGVGALPTTYLDNTKTYRLRIYDKGGALLDGGDIDPYIPGTIPDGSVLQPYVDDAEDAAVASAESAAESAASAATALAVLSSTAVIENATAHAETRAILAALNTALGPAYLSEAGREGMFVWSSSNLSASVTLDPQQGVYVAPASAPTGASGAWVRKYSGAISIKWFGAVGDNVTDDYTAIQAAIDFLSHGGGEIKVPLGKYRVSARLVWHAVIALIGSTTGQDSRGILGATGPTFTFDAGVGGVLVRFINDSDASGSPTIYSGGYGSLIQGIKFISLSAGAAAAGKYGIESRARITIRDCSVRSFGDNGIYLRGSLGGGDGVVYGNVSTSLVENTDCILNAGDGIKVSGNDANVVKLMRCLVQLNTGWGVTDDSFLGLNGDCCCFEGNTAGAVRQLRSPSPSVWLGCETEGGAISLGTSATVIGGNFGQATFATTGGVGYFMNAGIAQGAPYRHVNAVNTPTIGCYAGSISVETNPSAFSFGQESTLVYRDWRFALFPATSRWGWWYANSAATITMQFPDGTNSSGRSYAAEFPRGICIGNQASVQDKLWVTGVAAPVAGTWVAGDIVWGRTPTAGSVLAWRCVAGGTPGTWETLSFGVMTPTSIAATSFITSSGGGIGYATGAGGTVTQATSRTTGVTLNKLCGAITLVSAAGTATWQSFTVTNSQVAATDTIIVNQKSGTDKNMIFVTAVAAGSFQISFATTGGVTVEQPVFNFSVVKAVAA